jgi:hypothetical protein
VLAELDSETHEIGHPAWAPDGRQLVFHVRGAGEGALFTMNPDGSDVELLYDRPGWDDAEPTWSPDGRRIAFVSAPPGEARHSVWLLEPQSGIAGIAADDPVADLRSPAWTADGALLFARHESGAAAGAVLLLEAPGDAPTYLTSGAHPAWAAVAAASSTAPVGGSPTATTEWAQTSTPSPPPPTFPPPPPTPRPFPTIATAESTAPHPGPTFPPPSPTASATATASPTPTSAPSGIYLPACANGAPDA